MSNNVEKSPAPQSLSSLPPDVVDVASMAAARDPSPTAPPLASRDGFDLISRTPIVWDVDCCSRRRCSTGGSSTSTSTSTFHFVDILYHKSSADRAARICFNRPHVLNAFRPQTIREVQLALSNAADDPNVAVILLSSVVVPSQYTPAFCAGGDQNVRQHQEGGGYQDGTETAPKLRVLELQQAMRDCPKPMVAVVRGYAVGGGHVLHMLCDLTLASENAVFGQTGPRMGSFDAGYGCSQAVSILGDKRARELWFLCKLYHAHDARQLGLVNAVYPDADLDGRVAQWTRRMVMHSPTALACCKAACNAATEGNGRMHMGGQMTRLYYGSDEAKEGRDAFLEKRAPDFRRMQRRSKL